MLNSVVSSLSGLGESLKANQWNNIRHINISGNDIGARAFAGLCMALESMQHELISLNIGTDSFESQITNSSMY